MAKAESFDGLINSIQDAFLSVNKMSEQQHLESLNEYFDEGGNPRTFTVNFPFFADDGSIEYRQVDIPYFCMVPLSSLKIKEIDVDFKVMLAGKIRLNQRESMDSFAGSAAPGSDSIGYIPSFKQRSKGDSYANITLKFLAEEAPEGVLRLRDELIKIMP